MEELLSNCQRKGDCLEWMGRRGRDGYGRVNHPDHVLAHRAMWASVNGPIPPGMCVCHRCDNPPCCNPAHLFLDTHAGNMRDMARKKRAGCVKGERHGQAKITEPIVLEIIKSAESQRAIAARLGLGQTTISAIRRGKLWKHLRGACV